MAKTQALTKVQGEVKSFFLQEYVKKGIAAVAVKHADPDRLMRVALNTILTNPKLSQCSTTSLLRCVVLSAQLGLEPDPVLQLCAYIPYGTEAVFVPQYRGKLDLAYRSGLVKSVIANPVYERDFFEYSYGMPGKLDHQPYMGEEDPGPVVASYAVFEMKDGTYAWHVCPRYEIERHRAKSQNPSGKDRKGGYVAWDERGHYPEMAMKTAIHVTSKFVRLSPEYELTQVLDTRIQMKESQAGITSAMEDIFGIPDEPVDIEFEDTTEPERKPSEDPGGTPSVDPKGFSEPPPPKTKGMPKKPTFESLLKKKKFAMPDLAESRIQEFLEANAKHYKSSVEDVKREAVEKFDEFIQAFYKWNISSAGAPAPSPGAPEPPPPAEDPTVNDLYSAWITKHKVKHPGYFEEYERILLDYLNELAAMDSKTGLDAADFRLYWLESYGNEMYQEYAEWWKANKEAGDDGYKPSVNDLKGRIQDILEDWFPQYTWEQVEEWMEAEVGSDFQGLNIQRAERILELLSVPRDQCSLIKFHRSEEDVPM